MKKTGGKEIQNKKNNALGNIKVPINMQQHASKEVAPASCNMHKPSNVVMGSLFPEWEC
jgi:hypothetical protein